MHRGMHVLAYRSALAAAIASGEAQRTAGALVLGRLTDGREVPLGVGGDELKPSELPVFRLSTDGEAEDGNILDQEWDLSRASSGIVPILLNHSVRNEAPLGLGLWRSPRVVEVDGSRELQAEADFDLADDVGASAGRKVRAGYIRSVSVGWRPGFRTLRGDLPKDHRWYRAPMTDDCGTRIEGYVMGRTDEPNRLIEASLTPIPSDPAATQVGARLAAGERAVAALAAGERVVGIDLGAAMLALRDRPGVRTFLSGLIDERLAALGMTRAAAPISLDDLLRGV